MPKHETIRLRSAEALFAKINANDPAQRRAAADDARAMSGEYIMPPQVAALLRSGAATVPKAPERNWDALIEAARRKPRTDDDVLREKFGGGDAEVVGAASTGARHESVGLASGKSPCAPSSDLDPYEPIGTVPIVGDRVVCLINPRDSYPWVSRIHEEGARFASDDGVFEVRDCEFRRYDDRAWRILKRKAQTPQVPQADAPSQPFYYTPNGIVALGGNTARFAEYTLTYYDGNTGGPGSIVLGGGGARLTGQGQR